MKLLDASNVPNTVISWIAKLFQKMNIVKEIYKFPPLTGGNKLIESQSCRYVSKAHEALFIKALRKRPAGSFNTLTKSITMAPLEIVTESGLDLSGPG
jgi:hypothetical protein